MEESLDRLAAKGLEHYLRHWKLWLVLLWLGYAIWALVSRLNKINWLILSDTDDNLRLAQVRAWMGGQGWFDLVQHRFDPVHGGANIHWSRLVDLPIAGLITLFRPFLGPVAAERWAAGVAPLLPLLLLAFALALTARRLIGPKAWILPLLGLLGAGSTLGMFMPMRIDHHGWQLALLALAISGMADRDRARGGVVTGVATGLSLTIGLEMLIYLALLGGGVVLMWVVDRAQRQRMIGYAAALVATSAVGFLLFASYANRLPVCDALSPVWLSDAVVGGALLIGLAWLKVDSWKARLGAAVVAGIMVAAFHALAWPNCLQRLEGVSPEATQLWLSKVREARPFYRFDWRTAVTAIALPTVGLLGWIALLWNAWKSDDGDRDRFVRSAIVALPAIAALGLMAWQMRAAPAAQMMALPAGAALVLLVGKAMLDSDGLAKRIGGILVVTLGLGALVPVALMLVPATPAKPASKLVSAANAKCPSLPAMAPVGRQPRGVVFSFVDLGPRLIVTTHHDAIAGPYHRNDIAIANIMKAFRGTPDNARRIMTAYGSDYLLVCPDMSTATIFMAEAPQGFYAQLVKGKVPAWLQPIDLGTGSPLRMWKIVR